MFTDSGFGMVSGIVMCLMAVISLIIGVRQYRQKGRLFSITAFLAEADVQEKLNTKRIYRGMAWAFLTLGGIMLFLGIGFMIDNANLVYLGASLAFCQMCVGFMRFFFGVR